MTFQFDNRRALVTGASGGIGAHIARALAREGCHLIVVARRAELLEQFANSIHEEHGVSVDPIILDLARKDAVQQLLDRIDPTAIDILVNNAGIGVLGAFEKADPALLDQMLSLNIRFLTQLTRALLPHMLASGKPARILNVGSVAGHQGVPHMATYAATKGFVNHFSEGLAWELGKSKVRVSSLEPGQTSSGFFDLSDKRGVFVSRYGLLQPERVAKAAIRQLRSGRPRQVVGVFNKILVFTQKVAPRPFVGWVTRLMFRDMA